ncbi:MAG: rhomboid family intramembrane serine protease [Deltaproteobacteria bacterium]|nr:rhomboid family intramembrane serine protease [Deltaproteobacteria bacterium]MBW2669402.1 rhomboid family intramembrane serine protease [Deltaproteobacteria bacterium]
MIPIRDTIPSKNYPVVNHTIIGINVVLYLFEMSQGADLNRFIYIYGLVPARYSVPQVAAYFSTGQQLFSLLSFMFLHGGFFHLLGNMWFLYIFGDNIEDRLGPFRYIAFYLLCGITSGLSHLVLNLHSNMPTIGASGAVAGVMGAYLILHPHAKILTLIPIIIIPWFIEIPAFFFLGLWFVLQFLNATGTHGGAGGIAWWAHIGGFVFGIVFLKILLVLPETGVTDRIRRVTAKRKTHRLQVIRPVGPGNDPHLYGTIAVTSFEALVGTKKLVNIPWGFQKRIVKVIVPPGIKEGSKLRLKGLGKTTSDGERGDLYLKVAIVN